MTAEPALRVVIAEDHAFFRELVSGHLRQTGIDVVAEVTDSARLMRAVRDARPDVAIIDIRLAPGSPVNGLQAAIEIRRDHPEVGVLVLSQYTEVQFFTALVKGGMRKVGYLLKERVTGANGFVAAVRRIASGGYVVDPAIASLMLKGRPGGGLGGLTKRQLEVLAAMAEGLSKGAIRARLSISRSTVQTHIRDIFDKLGIQEVPENDQRVVAVLMYLRSNEIQE